MDESRKLLVLSDTHGHVPALKEVLNWAHSATMFPAQNNTHSGGTIGAAVFLGDGLQDLSRAAEATGFSCEWKLVRGNNDHGFSIPEAAVFDFEGKRFFMCHGHRYALYSGYHTLIAAARNAEADAVLFGHSHVPCFKKADGLLLINPGSIGSPRSRIGATFAVIGCSPEKPIEVEFLGIGPRGEIKKIKFE